jgi:hypothetical protein
VQLEEMDAQRGRESPLRDVQQREGKYQPTDSPPPYAVDLPLSAPNAPPGYVHVEDRIYGPMSELAPRRSSNWIR